MAVSGNKDSLWRQVKQLNARLLLKGFELCSGSPQVHPPPPVCLLISVCWTKSLCITPESSQAVFWCQAGVLESGEPFPWPALAPEPRWLSLVLAASPAPSGAPQFILQTTEWLGLALAEGLWLSCLPHCSPSGALLEPGVAPVPSS